MNSQSVEERRVNDNSKIRACVSGKSDFVNRWLDICDKSHNRETKWIALLRYWGFKAAHPNDGWIDREDKNIFFSYPQFFDNLQVGDMVMLGWASDEPKKWRPVRVIKKMDWFMSSHKWAFKDIDGWDNTAIKIAAEWMK